MKTYSNEDPVNLLIEIVKDLIRNNSLNDAFHILNMFLTNLSPDIDSTIVLNESQFNSLKKKIVEGEISYENSRVEEVRIKKNILSIVTDLIPSTLKTRAMHGSLNHSIYKTSPIENIEKLLGPINNLLKINWLEQGIKASKSVCKVVRGDGHQGTGFILKGGYLLTNYHVLPDVQIVETARIIFDYEEDLWGNLKRTSDFSLDSSISKFSSLEKLDYAYIKIIDNQENPLSQWGHLDLDKSYEPIDGTPVTIIQHPFGQVKQIALTANRIIGRDGNKIFYETDTEKGSSGSPVFSSEWKVIALHHAGRKEENGGLIINSLTGKRCGANEGILIKEIVNDIGI